MSVKRIGRPMKAPTNKRVSLGLKVTADIKRRIDQAALASGRTQSQEAEHRIELSYHYERAIAERSAAPETKPQVIDKDFRSEMEVEFHRLRLENGRLIGVLRDAELIRVNLLAEISRLHELVIILKKPKQRERKK